VVKSETRAKDVQGGGDAEFTLETFYSEFKKVDGVMTPHKIKAYRDGKLYVDSENSDYKLSDKLDDDLFAKP
jgi:hypothetical protein